MKLSDMTELAVRNLREAILRNSLTTLGVAVGVASLVAMLSLGVGLQQLATRRLAGSGMFDTVFVTSKQDFRGFDREDDQKTEHPEKAPILDQPARDQEIKIEIAHDLSRIVGGRGGERAVHVVKRLRKHRRESSPLEPLDHRLVGRKDRVEDRVRRDVDRQLRLKDLVVGVSVARELEPRGHGKAFALDHGELGRLAVRGRFTAFVRG